MTSILTPLRNIIYIHTKCICSKSSLWFWCFCVSTVKEKGGIVPLKATRSFYISLAEVGPQIDVLGINVNEYHVYNANWCSDFSVLAEDGTSSQSPIIKGHRMRSSPAECHFNTTFTDFMLSLSSVVRFIFCSRSSGLWMINDPVFHHDVMTYRFFCTIRYLLTSQSPSRYNVDSVHTY